jgi:predicted ATP-grasp superfamily ATP-dependent carboligase
LAWKARMRIFVYEYTCCAGISTMLSTAALHTEGWAMLSAVTEDFSRIPGIEITTLLAYNEEDGCPTDPVVAGAEVFGSPGRTRAGVYKDSSPCHAKCVCHRIPLGAEPASFRELARTADYTLVIAPEFDDLLLTRCRWVKEVNGRLLGPSLTAVALTADKMALSQHWRDHGVPTPQCFPFRMGNANAQLEFPIVCKPRFGAGSAATFRVETADQFHACMIEARREGWTGEMMLQRYQPGQPASVALLCGPRGQVPLAPATQHLSADGRFHYRGGRLPLAPPLAKRATRLAQHAVRNVSGLMGFVGVDLVLGDALDGSQDCAVEINPRLTTSYVGLRTLAKCNLAESMLRIALGEEVPAPEWRQGTIDFQADGRIC